MSIKVSRMSPSTWHSFIHVSSMPHVYPAPPQTLVFKLYPSDHQHYRALYRNPYQQWIDNGYESKAHKQLDKQGKPKDCFIHYHLHHWAFIVILQCSTWLIIIQDAPVPCLLGRRLSYIDKFLIKGKHDVINHRHCVINIVVEQGWICLFEPTQICISIPILVERKNYQVCSDVMLFQKLFCFIESFNIVTAFL